MAKLRLRWPIERYHCYECGHVTHWWRWPFRIVRKRPVPGVPPINRDVLAMLEMMTPMLSPLSYIGGKHSWVTDDVWSSRRLHWSSGIEDDLNV